MCGSAADRRLRLRVRAVWARPAVGARMQPWLPVPRLAGIAHYLLGCPEPRGAAADESAERDDAEPRARAERANARRSAHPTLYHTLRDTRGSRAIPALFPKPLSRRDLRFELSFTHQNASFSTRNSAPISFFSACPRRRAPSRYGFSSKTGARADVESENKGCMVAVRFFHILEIKGEVMARSRAL